MKTIRESDLDEYACQFWLRQAGKCDQGDKVALVAVTNWESPLGWLQKCHNYKIPFDSISSSVRVVELNRKDVACLVVNQGLATPEWMGKPEEGLSKVPTPCPRRLRELAALHVADGYFTREGPGTPRKLYRKWKEAGTLERKLVAGCRPLLSHQPSDELEIGDGWGRLLAYESLVQEGFEFFPVEAFVAYRPTTLEAGAQY